MVKVRRQSTYFERLEHAIRLASASCLTVMTIGWNTAIGDLRSFISRRVDELPSVPDARRAQVLFDTSVEPSMGIQPDINDDALLDSLAEFLCIAY